MKIFGVICFSLLALLCAASIVIDNPSGGGGGSGAGNPIDSRAVTQNVDFAANSATNYSEIGFDNNLIFDDVTTGFLFKGTVNVFLSTE